MALTHELFITHAWNYDDAFYRILDYLDQISNTYEDFNYINHAQPEPEAPDLSYTDELKVEYEDQISKSNAVVLLADLYREPEKEEVNLQFWLNFAIEHAQKQEIPIFGLRPWNETKTPAEISDIPDYWMDWDPESIKKIIQNHT